MGNILVYDFYGIKTMSSIIGISLNSFLFMLLIPFLENNGFINDNLIKLKPIKIIVQRLSILTYSIYLIHLPIFNLIIISDRTKGFTIQWFFEIVIAMFTVFIISAILYRFYEKPAMKLREKFK